MGVTTNKEKDMHRRGTLWLLPFGHVSTSCLPRYPECQNVRHYNTGRNQKVKTSRLQAYGVPGVASDPLKS